MKIAVNGAGRIGRCLVRMLIQDDNFNLCHVNDPYLTAESFCYLVNFDSVYGLLNKKIKCLNNKELVFGKKKIIFTKNKDLYENNFTKDLDILVDSSGIRENHDKILKFKNKKKFKALITHTYEKADIQVIFGVNEKKFKNNKHQIISTSICDAVAIGPILNLINKEYKLEKGSILTLHPWLGYQNLVDGPSRSFAYPGEIIENFSLGRASTEALIPKQTSCISAINSVIPGMTRKISSMSFRVPTQIVSSAFLSLSFSQKFLMKDFLKKVNNFISNQENKILTYNTEQCISKDFIKNEYSTIIDKRWIEVKNNNLRLLLWYDNEYGYSSRVIDLIKNIKINEKI
jgi:glyceraldehyde 3-phosphate dehydrogenase